VHSRKEVEGKWPLFKVSTIAESAFSVTVTMRNFGEAMCQKESFLTTGERHHILGFDPDPRRARVAASFQPVAALRVAVETPPASPPVGPLAGRADF
jgi:hypothetical protein